MATNVLDRVEGNKTEEEEETTEKIDEKLSLSKEIMAVSDNEEDTGPVKDTDFYTRSMDLSDKDFNLSDEFKEKSLPFFVKVLIFLLIMALIAAVIYFVKIRIA